MIMKFKFLNLKTRSYLRKNKTLRFNTSYNTAKRVGVIFSVEDRQKHDDVKEFIKKLEHDGKHVSVMAFLPPDHENYEFLFDFFTEREISFWGNITATNAIQFADTSFDFLFCLDSTPNPLILNLIAKSKAKCRVGKCWSQGSPYFEMMIESNGTTKSLIDQVYQYTKALK
jgi:hypothetical protein